MNEQLLQNAVLSLQTIEKNLNKANKAGAFDLSDSQTSINALNNLNTFIMTAKKDLQESQTKIPVESAAKASTKKVTRGK